MNARDDGAAYYSRKAFSEGARYRDLRPTAENFLCGQETSERELRVAAKTPN